MSKTERLISVSHLLVQVGSLLPEFTVSIDVVLIYSITYIKYLELSSGPLFF